MGDTEDFFREVQREEERKRDREVAERLNERATYSPGSPSSPRHGCLYGCGVFVVAVVALIAWLCASEFAKRDEIRVVTAVLCGKEKVGQDWLIHTSEGDFRLGDVPAKTAAQQYESLRTDSTYDIVYQGMEMFFLPRPVTHGVVLLPEGPAGHYAAPCPAER